MLRIGAQPRKIRAWRRNSRNGSNCQARNVLRVGRLGGRIDGSIAKPMPVTREESLWG